MAQTDEETKKFLLDLMQRIPGELATIARETRTLVDRARGTVGCAEQEIAALSRQLGEIEERIHKLCNVATQAVNIAPLWQITQEDGEESPE